MKSPAPAEAPRADCWTSCDRHHRQLYRKILSDRFRPAAGKRWSWAPIYARHSSQNQGSRVSSRGASSCVFIRERVLCGIVATKYLCESATTGTAPRRLRGVQHAEALCRHVVPRNVVRGGVLHGTQLRYRQRPTTDALKSACACCNINIPASALFSVLASGRRDAPICLGRRAARGDVARPGRVLKTVQLSII
ncbi:hypothetical protein EVAR_9953_1 [Eumeta japonica]|uniref:Uncharacterized protein n=1 Tax=Eumeta variegata TaxID=151549 RepID=A0A4C1TR20_EUMVA|nr:hypothetical protein EVAR_9953_1 [Eumeta japonica]